jgi:precorrin-4 methylase
MVNFVSKSIRYPLGRLSSWLGRIASRDTNLSGDVPSSSRDLINTNEYPPLHEGGYFRRNSRLREPLPIQLSIHTLDDVVRELVPFFGENCPISVIYNKSPAQSVHHAEVVQATLSSIRSASDHSPHTRSAFILVG